MNDFWIEGYPSNRKPNIVDIKNYLSPECLIYYERFIGWIEDELNLKYRYLKYNKKNGWVLSVGRSGLILVKNITFSDHCVYIIGVKCYNEETYNKITEEIKNAYYSNFVDKFEELKIRRTKTRKDKEDAHARYLENIINTYGIDLKKFNVFKWPDLISHDKIIKLYLSDANRIYDEELVDDVGLYIYVRCKQARETRECISQNKIRCHNCGNILDINEINAAVCICGYAYTMSEYKKSFINNKMPSGNAVPVFDAFEKNWLTAKCYSEKMKLIDGIIHEVHYNMNNGMYGRIVGMQIIEGTSEEIKELILYLSGEINQETELTKKFRYLTSGLNK